MTRWTWLLLPFAVGCTVLSEPADDEQAIARLRQELAAAMNAGNVERILELFTDDVVLMPPGAPLVRGAGAARQMFVGLFTQVTLDETWTSEEILVTGDVAYDWSSYAVRVTTVASGESVDESGQNFFVARRARDGTWKYSRLIWNRDQPPSSE